MQSSFEISFENVSAAEANRLAAELEGLLRRTHPDASGTRKRPDEATMDLGTVVLAVVGSAAATAVAQGIAAWLGKLRGASIKITGEGIEASGIRAQDTARLAKIFTKSRK